MNLSKLLTRKVIIILSAALAAAAAIAAGIALAHSVKHKLPAIAEELSSAVSSSAVSEIKPTESSKPEDTSPQLVITEPSKLNSSTTSSVAVIRGTSDPAHSLLLNGAELVRNADGSFAYETTLNVGKNVFTFKHKEKETVCTINYRYVVINAYLPSKAQKYSSGSTFGVVVAARPGSSVTAAFNGKTIILSQNQTAEEGEEFVNFGGSFTLPNDNVDNLNLGKVKFTASFNGITESFSSGNITCLKNDALANVPYIAEITAFTAETFNGNTTDDYSRPTNNYLPKGTVDYCDRGLIVNGDNTYVKLRCGRRVYTEKYNKPDPGGKKQAVIRRYQGTLPDHNKITFASFKDEGRHTILTVSPMWKAPFFFDLLPQSYANPTLQRYEISSATYEYIDITFCYATKYTGSVEIPKDNSIFSRAEIRQSGGNTILRLYLRTKGVFFGWDCHYNENGQLVFEFLNPKKTTVSSNKYGIDFNGATILIDAGHGGVDSGAGGAYGTKESERNLNLANKIAAELRAAGAKVVLTRSSDVNVKYDERRQLLKSVKPDYCIAIHHDSANAPSANGYSAFYSQPFSMNAAKSVYDRTAQAGIYNRPRGLGWHYFFLAQSTACPVVLTENGFISNSGDLSGIRDEATNQRKAEAIVKGIADYFNSIRDKVVEPSPEPEPPETEPEQPPVNPDPPEQPNPPETEPPIDPEEPEDPDLPPDNGEDETNENSEGE